MPPPSTTSPGSITVTIAQMALATSLASLATVAMAPSSPAVAAANTCRADVARTLIRMVSISARISTELEELKRSQKMSSLWKLHADSIVVLLDMASTSTEEAGSVAKSAEQSGSGPAGRSIHESVQKLRTQSDIAVKTLANVS